MRAWALVASVAIVALTVAQDAMPGRDYYHSWQYLTLLGLGVVVAGAYAWQAVRNADGPVGRRLAVAAAGAVVVGCAGFAAGLIGPDTVTVTGAPGSVTPVPDIAAAAAFPAADAAAIERGDAMVTLRRRGAAPLDVGERPVLLGLSVVFAQRRRAAFVAAADTAGRRLTVTQPVNPSFLSPVIFFRDQQTIRGRRVPFDEFAVPGAHRIVHALVFSPADLAAFGRSLPDGSGALILSVEDERGNPHGVGIALSGQPARIGDLVLTVTTGSYPVLIVAAAPEPFAAFGGIALFVLGCAWAVASVVGRAREREALELHGRNDHAV